MIDFISNLHFFLGEDIYSFLVSTLKAIGIIILSILIARFGSYTIKKIFEKQKSFKYGLNSKKVSTMATLLISVFKYAVYIVTAIVILSDIFDLKSILAAAGIGGIALGLGSQSLIKDIISGFFIILEDQFAVEDTITIDGLTGTVEQMELRVTRLRNFNGDLYIIPNGEIKKVINHTRGNKAVIVDIPIAYSTNIGKAFDAATAICEKVAGEFENLIEEPKVLGITDLGKDNMNVRIMAKTPPNENWEVERRIRMLIKEAFETEKFSFNDRNRVTLDNTYKEDGVNGR